MAKKKFSVDALKAAGEAAHLQPNKTKPSDVLSKIGGEVLLEIDVDEIENNPMQPRISLNDEKLHELALSIKSDGLITPISLFSKPEGGYVLKAGQRRWLAHKLLGMKKIKAVVSESTFNSHLEQEKAFFEIAVAENLHRDNLDPLEMAISIDEALKKGYYKSAEEVAKGIKKSKSFVSKLMKVLKLDQEILDDLRRNRSTKDIEALYLLQNIKEPQVQVRKYYDFVQKRIDRNDLRQMIKTGVSHAKLPYDIRITKKSVTFKASFENLNEQARKSLDSELKSLFDKYRNMADK
jgi:ParB family chromosome partitioning protein